MDKLKELFERHAENVDRDLIKNEQRVLPFDKFQSAVEERDKQIQGETCKWKKNEDGTYSPSCISGIDFDENQFSNMESCPYCSKPIEMEEK